MSKNRLSAIIRGRSPVGVQIRWLLGVVAASSVLIFGKGLLSPAQDEIALVDFSLNPAGPAVVRHEVNAEYYYRLLRGVNPGQIESVMDVRLGDAGRLEDSQIQGLRRAFYRVEGVSRDDPKDSDGDGIDDLYELQRPNILHPLNDVDAGQDPDGNGRTHLDDYILAKTPLTTIKESSPARGEDGVAITRESIIRFTAPLAAGATFNEQELYAEFGGQRLPARRHLSADRRSVTLFYDSLLPSSARVRLTVKGDNVADELGRTIDPDGDALPGGTATIDFDTLSLTVLDGTAVCGRVFASELEATLDGQMTMNRPLEGVKITVDGAEDTLFAFTDQFGDFRLEPAPAGRFFVHIDGRTATENVPSGSYYPFVGKAWESIPLTEVNIGEVYLPLVQDGTLQTVSQTQATEIAMAPSVLAEFPEFADVSITVPAGALIYDDGTPGGMVGIAPVPPERLPGDLPDGLRFPLVITVQTDGATNFDQPAPICLPNLPDPVTGELLGPGEKSALFSFNHDAGRFEMVGSMTVSGDGTLVCSDPGVGILAPGWHGGESASRGKGGEKRTGVTQTRNKPCPNLLPPEEDPPNEALLANQLNHEESSPEAEGEETQEEEKKKEKQECKQDDCDACCTCKTGQSVLLHSGEERFQRTDLVIPGRGQIHFIMARTYRSRLDYDGPLGFAWNFTYNEGLYLEKNGGVTRVSSDSHLNTWERKADGGFQAPVGQFRDLHREPNGTFVLTEGDGFRRFYSADGRLFCHRDRFGNQMLFDYDPRGNLKRVIDAYGREINFIFQTFADGIDRLIKVRDFIGREVAYSYDARGDLVEVRTPTITGTSTGNDFPNGRAERYHYSSGFAAPELNHNLLSVTYPQEVATGGPVALSWTYGTNPSDRTTFDRVLSETEGGTNASGVPAGGTMSFEYTQLNQDVPPGDLSVPRGKVRVTERNGNVWEYFANENNQHIIMRQFTRGLREGEPEYYETRSVYDIDGLLLRRIFPEGNEVHYAYATNGGRRQQQNVVEVRRVADAARGGGEDIVTTIAYEPLFNQVASVTGPRGNATGFVPPLGSASKERYTTHFIHDYQESNAPVPLAQALGIDLSGVPRGLGDVNGDGRTDQAVGNAVRFQAPSVQLRPDSHEAARLGSTTQEILTDVHWNDHGQVVSVIDPEGNVTDIHYHPENDPDGDGLVTHSLYMPLNSDPTGYPKATVADSRTSPRRSAATPPVALTTEYRYDAVGNLITTRDPRGVETHIEVNQLNEPVVITRGADVSHAVASGQLLTDETPLAYRTRLRYDHNGRVVATEMENRDGNTDGVGAFVDQAMSYDILNNVVATKAEVDSGKSLVTHYRYDPSDLPITVIKPEGNQIRTSYDERNLTYQVTTGFGSPGASTTQVDYDDNGNPIRTTDGEDNDGDGQPEAVQYAYDGFDRPVTVTDALGNHAITTYDVGSNVIQAQVIGHPVGNPAGAGVLLSDARADHDEVSRIYRRDESIFLTAGFAPARTPQLMDQNGDGLVTELMEFDALSRVTHFIEDDLQVMRAGYDGASRLIETIDALGNTKRVIFDRNSNPVSVTNIERPSPDLLPQPPAETFTTHYLYDQLDRLIRATDNAGQTTRFRYDSRNNLVERSDSEGALLDDPLGIFPAVGQLGQINAAGNTKTYVYDGIDRMIGQICDLRVGGVGGGPLALGSSFNPDGQVSLRFEFDDNSRLSGIIDDSGNRTTFGHDALDRRVSQTDADGEMYTFTYDRDHNLVQAIDPNGSVVTKTYDAINRLVRNEIARAPGVLGTTLQTFAYDGLSRLTRSTDDNGAAGGTQTCEFVFDSLSRLIEERQNGLAVSTVLSGDGKRLQCTYPGGRVIQHSHDLIDRQTKTSDAAGLISQCFYIGPAQREVKRLYGNGTSMSTLNDDGSQDIGFDAVKRLQRLRHLLADGSAFIDRLHTYNRTDHRTSEQRLDDFGLTDRNEYDSLYRVEKSDYDIGGLPGGVRRQIEQIGYAYDGVGNRREVAKVAASAPLAAVAYAVNEMNEYTAVGGVSRNHSKNGNLLSDGERTLHYDYNNRLVRVERASDGAAIAEYRYFADNRRAEKEVFADGAVSGAPAGRTIYNYNGWQVIEERNGQDTSTVTYVYSGRYIDEPVHLRRTADHPVGEGAAFFHQNARFDVVAMSNGTGSVVEKRVYDDFGKVHDETKQAASASNQGNPYGFQGRRIDAETGFYFFRNRHYDPNNGRFIQRDPLWDLGNIGNVYSFPGNDSISRADPLGLSGGYLVELYGRSLQGDQEAEEQLAASAKKAIERQLKYGFLPGQAGMTLGMGEDFFDAFMANGLEGMGSCYADMVKNAPIIGQVRGLIRTGAGKTPADRAARAVYAGELVLLGLGTRSGFNSVRGASSKVTTTKGSLTSGGRGPTMSPPSRAPRPSRPSGNDYNPQGSWSSLSECAGQSRRAKALHLERRMEPIRTAARRLDPGGKRTQWLLNQGEGYAVVQRARDTILIGHATKDAFAWMNPTALGVNLLRNHVGLAGTVRFLACNVGEGNFIWRFAAMTRRTTQGPVGRAWSDFMVDTPGGGRESALASRDPDGTRRAIGTGHNHGIVFLSGGVVRWIVVCHC